MTVYWIDDSRGSMLGIVRGLFIDLWKLEAKEEEHIKSKIYIFGNMSYLDSEMLLSEKEEKKFYNSIVDIFKKYCDHIDGLDPERSTFKKRRELLKDIVTFVFKKDDEAEKLETYKRLLKLYESSEFQDPENKECKGEEEIGKVVDLLGISKEEPAVVAIDVMLMKGDFDRCMNGNFMVSMELYHQFCERKIPRFLYSMDATEKEMMEKWVETFKKVYPADEVPEIHLRESFGEKINHDISGKIAQLCIEEKKKWEENKG